MFILLLALAEGPGAVPNEKRGMSAPHRLQTMIKQRRSRRTGTSVAVDPGEIMKFGAEDMLREDILGNFGYGTVTVQLQSRERL